MVHKNWHRQAKYRESNITQQDRCHEIHQYILFFFFFLSLALSIQTHIHACIYYLHLPFVFCAVPCLASTTTTLHPQSHNTSPRKATFTSHPAIHIGKARPLLHHRKYFPLVSFFPSPPPLPHSVAVIFTCFRQTNVLALLVTHSLARCVRWRRLFFIFLSFLIVGDMAL